MIYLSGSTVYCLRLARLSFFTKTWIAPNPLQVLPLRPLPRVGPTENLVNMVLDVTDVAGDNRLERGRLGISGVARVLQRRGINMFDDMRKMRVGVVPDMNEIIPRVFLIMLGRDPMGLSIFECANIRFFLHADNPLTIVTFGINQMSKDFFERPLFTVWFVGCLAFRQ
jgi:hypothetical protein